MKLSIDGSSTVYPITENIVDRYKTRFNNLVISIKVSGTGGGFEKFSKNQIGINNASRKIKESEDLLCKQNNIGYKVIEVAYDGIAVVTNSNNSFVDYLTVEELKRIWKKDGAKTWSDVRTGWPEEPIKLYGPGDASGTHDYFGEAILGDEEFRTDYTKSENDNLLVRGVGSNEFEYALGFFGLAYYEENKSNLKLVPIDNGNGPVTPSTVTISTGDYTPLSRPMFLYVNNSFLEDKVGKGFITFYLQNAAEAAESVGYVALPAKRYNDAISTL